MTCAIVDGYSTGKNLPSYLHKKGYECIHIQTSMYAAAKNSFNPDDYRIHLIYENNFDHICNTLKNLSVKFIIPGCETGVELADSLSTALNLFPNEPGTGERCRNKFLTGQALENANLRSIKQIKVKTVREAIDWVHLHTKWPVVIKPLDSGGGDCFYICEDENKLIQAITSTLKSKTIFNKNITEILVQEYVEGPEYVVNTVSHNSFHYVESFMTYKKTLLSEGHLVYDTISLLDPEDCPISNEIFNYTFSALNALGLKFGAAHNEIIFTSTGPVLLECNARLMGASLPQDVIVECLGTTQVELTVLSYTSSKEFLELFNQKRNFYKHMLSVHLISKEEGIIKEIQIPEEITKLPSFHSLRIHSTVEGQIKKTVDLPTSPGEIFLISDNKNILEKDASDIRKLEKKGFFVIDTET